MLKLVEQEGIDVVLPESSHDLDLADRRGDSRCRYGFRPRCRRRANDKAETFEACTASVWAPPTSAA